MFMDTQEKIEIKNLYIGGLSTVKLGKKYHVSPNKIKSILLEFGIDIHSENRGFGPKQNKPSGYWNDKAKCEEAAKECRNRYDFGMRYVSAYRYSLKNGWLDEFSDKYFAPHPLFQTSASTTHCVYSYEFTESKCVYVGRTNNLKRRNYSHHKDLNDTVFKYSQSSGYDIPDVRVLSSSLTAEQSLVDEENFVETYKTNGWNVLNRQKCGLYSGSLGSSPKKWTYETCKKAANECCSREEYKKKYSRAHNVSRENGWIDEFFPVLYKKPNGYFDSLDNCKKESEKFKSIIEIRNKYPFLYHKISKNKWVDAIREHIHENKKEIKASRKGFLSFNNNNGDLAGKLDKYGLKFLKTLENITKKQVVIDYASEIGRRIIFRVDSSKVLFVFVYVRGCGSFSSNLKNRYHSDLMVFCEYLGYKVLQIYDFEFQNKQKTVIDMIKYHLNKMDFIRKINGRKCHVMTVDNKQAGEFLDSNHILGHGKASIYLGAFYNDILCGIMCFKKCGNNKDGEWELIRFASNNHYLCRGVGGKIFKYFIKHYQPLKVISFADKRFSSIKENLYSKIGFKYNSETSLSYKYFNCNDLSDTTLYHKLHFKKKVLIEKFNMDNSKSEAEMAKELGYDRIWDCGLIKYVWTAE